MLQSSIMRGYLLVLSLLGCSCQTINYTGSAFIYHPLQGSSDTTVLRYKVAFRECGTLTAVDCPPDLCTLNVVSVNRVDENIGEWCQDEVVVHVNDIEDIGEGMLRLEGIAWINVTNNVTFVLAETRVEPRIRSDTGRPNLSPPATMLPVYRLPSNCFTQIQLPVFDSEGDDVDCFPEKPDNNPDFLFVFGCFLNFESIINDSSVEGLYAVQLRMADIALEELTLTGIDVDLRIVNKNEIISEVPIQFVLRVDPPVESCTPGEYLPKFLDPTPKDGEHFYAFVNQTLEIHIYADAKMSSLTQVLFSGPAGVTKTALGGGHFVLAWTPTVDDSGLRQTICFVVEATLNADTFQSIMRCVVVAVDHLTFLLDASLRSRSKKTRFDLNNFGLRQLKKELVERGLPPDITLRVVNFTETTPHDD